MPVENTSQQPRLFTTRRNFLASTSALSAAATLGATLAVPRAAHADSDETIKIALIGCGGRGTGAASQALATNLGPVKLWAVADAFADRIETSLNSLAKTPGMADKIDVPQDRRFVGLDAYRKAIDSGVDLVVIAAPPGYRPQHFEYAVKAGKHVFMEKPVATDAPGVRRLLAANHQAKSKGLKVGVGLQRHHDPVYLDLVKRLQDGAVGDITFYRCYWDTSAPAKQPVKHDGLTELEYQVRNWYFFNWLSGDHIVEQHIHTIDVCNWIQGATPISASGHGGRQVRTGREYGNIFDHHSVEFTYANGAKMFSNCRQIPGCYNQVAEFAHGTRGWSDVSGGSLFPSGSDEIRLRPNSRSRRTNDRANPFQIEHVDLMDAIRNSKDYNEVEYGALSSMTAILGRMATYSGKLVTWDEALASALQLTSDAEHWSDPAPLAPQADGSYAIAMPGITKAV
ncbi:MAG TPA: Gfo/Idh/MocA family oxidoreductase [Pirellulales bacterium]|nr:Gfo/Idh/MocA family oxidoreductase [Pirellulales bacterium]